MSDLIDRLERFPVVVAALCGKLTSEQARWTYERRLADAAPFRADYAGPWT